MIRFRTLGGLDLRDAAGQELRSLLAQPKRVALLTYLALEAADGFCRRDSLLPLFWPEFDQERARKALRQALHFLRRALGSEAIVSRGDEELGLNTQLIWCDVVSFQRALDQGNADQAVDLYRGDLLPGFFVSDGSAAFDQWLDDVRKRLRTLAAQAAWGLADAAERAGNPTAAVLRARDAVRLAPDDEAGVTHLIMLLDRLGDRTGALRLYDEFVRRLHHEFELEPTAALRARMTAVRTRDEGVPIPDPDRAEAQNALADSSSERGSIGPAANDKPNRVVARTAPYARKATSLRIAAVGVIALTVLLVAVTLWRRERASNLPMLAVGWVENGADSSSAETARLIPGLLATDLSRVRGLHVISDARIYEVLSQLGTGEANEQALTLAARRAGADELLEGMLYQQRGGLRLDLRRVDLRSGVVRQSYTARGADAFELAEQATANIARGFMLDPIQGAMIESSTSSLLSRRFYEQGLRSYFRGEWRAAHELFAGAVAEDSTFAMASHYASLSKEMYDGPGAATWTARANRMAELAPERDRLLIKLHNRVRDYAARLAAADSLADRFPSEPDGHLALASLKVDAGDFLRAIPHARRVLAMDSLSVVGKTLFCRACQAYGAMINAYLALDSFPAAERTAREWIQRQPSGQAWSSLVEVLGRQGLRDSAQHALRTRLKVEPSIEGPDREARLAIIADDFIDADRLLTDRLRHDREDFDAHWLLVISLRNQGRMREALALLNGVRKDLRDGNWRLAEAQVLFESGRFRQAAAHFDSLVHFYGTVPGLTPGGLARHESWGHTHAATAWAAAGDTAILQSIADSIEAVAHLSSYGRDWRLPHHVRGLSWKVRAQPQRAMEAFRAAVYSPTLGFTRTNLELALSLLALNRPSEAVTVLRSSFRGLPDGSNYFVTRTELHDLLARSFERANQPDSAIAHYRKVIAAWSHGDPEFRARADNAQKALVRLSH